jgi:hypothetical protein
MGLSLSNSDDRLNMKRGSQTAGACVDSFREQAHSHYLSRHYRHRTLCSSPRIYLVLLGRERVRGNLCEHDYEPYQ